MPVVNLQLELDPPHVVVGSPVKVQVAMESGDDVTLYYDMGLGSPFEHEESRKCKQLKFGYKVTNRSSGQ